MKKKQRLIYKRKRLNKTDYKARLALLKSRKPRLVIRKSLKSIVIQLVQYNENGDKVLFTVNSRILKKFGFQGYTRNTPSSYLTGLLAGIKAKQKNILSLVPDIGLNKKTKGGVIFAAIKGVSDAGISIQFSKEILPDEKRIKGEHLKNINFDQVKSKIMQELQKSITK